MRDFMRDLTKRENRFALTMPVNSIARICDMRQLRLLRRQKY